MNPICGVPCDPYPESIGMAAKNSSLDTSFTGQDSKLKEMSSIMANYMNANNIGAVNNTGNGQNSFQAMINDPNTPPDVKAAAQYFLNDPDGVQAYARLNQIDVPGNDGISDASNFQATAENGYQALHDIPDSSATNTVANNGAAAGNGAANPALGLGIANMVTNIVGSALKF